MSLNRAVALLDISSDEGCGSVKLGNVLGMSDRESRPIALGLVKLGLITVSNVPRERGRKLKFCTTEKGRDLILRAEVEAEVVA